MSSGETASVEHMTRQKQPTRHTSGDSRVNIRVCISSVMLKQGRPLMQVCMTISLPRPSREDSEEQKKMSSAYRKTAYTDTSRVCMGESSRHTGGRNGHEENDGSSSTHRFKIEPSLMRDLHISIHGNVSAIWRETLWYRGKEEAGYFLSWSIERHG